jgi:hypothetical protein
MALELHIYGSRHTYIDDYQRLKVRVYLITKGQRVMCGLTTAVLVRSDHMGVGPRSHPSRSVIPRCATGGAKAGVAPTAS